MLHYSHRYISSRLILRHWSPSGKIASSHVALRCHIRNFSNNNSKQKVVSSRSQNSEASQQVKQLSFLQRWMGPKEIPPRWTLPWYGEMTLICTVFAIAGSSTMFMVRPAMNKVLGLKGSMKEGPWTYRLSSFFIMTPIYPFVLVTVGTIFGRHLYFRHFAVKMISRFGIPPHMLGEKIFRETAKTFRKW